MELIANQPPSSPIVGKVIFRSGNWDAVGRHISIFYETRTNEGDVIEAKSRQLTDEEMDRFLSPTRAGTTGDVMMAGFMEVLQSWFGNLTPVEQVPTETVPVESDPQPTA